MKIIPKKWLQIKKAACYGSGGLKLHTLNYYLPDFLVSAGFASALAAFLAAFL